MNVDLKTAAVMVAMMAVGTFVGGMLLNVTKETRLGQYAHAGFDRVGS
jgi:uncharacterized membrane protein YfcA